jgi:hypothetical protein
LDGLEGDPVAGFNLWLGGVWDDLTSKKRWVEAAKNVNQSFNPLYIGANHISKIATGKDLEGIPNDFRGTQGAVSDAGVDVMAWVTGERFLKIFGGYGTNALEAELNSARSTLQSPGTPKPPVNKPVLQDLTAEETKALSTRAKTIISNKSNSLTSEAIVEQRLRSQLGPDEDILAKPRIYIGDGSSGKYAQPDFAVYNTKSGQFVKLVDAKDGNATLTTAQKQINKYGGVFKGTSRADDVVPQKVAPNPEAIQIERTNVAQSSN